MMVPGLSACNVHVLKYMSRYKRSSHAVQFVLNQFASLRLAEVASNCPKLAQTTAVCVGTLWQRG